MSYQFCSDTSLSLTGMSIRESLREIYAQFDRSSYLSKPKTEAIRQLNSLYQEFNSANWDGHGALPMSVGAVRRTESFIKSLPWSIVMPEFAADPDGSITLDWIKSRNRMLILSIDSSDRIAFAWKNESEGGRGFVDFNGSEVPYKIISIINLIF